MPEGAGDAALAAEALMAALVNDRKAKVTKFKRKQTNLRKLIDQCKPVEMLQNLWQELDGIYSELDGVNDSILANCSDPEQAAANENFMDEYDKLKNEVHEKLIERKKRDEDNVKANIDVKKLPPPTFTGKSARSFPTFLKEYKRLMVPKYGRDPFVLRSCLKDEAEKLVENLDDYESMIERLKEVYGSSSKLVKIILQDVYSMKPVKEKDFPRLVELINCIEKAWIEINALDEKQELENTTVYDNVISLLPVSIQLEWEKIAPDDSYDRFEQLVTYLKEQRRVVERLLQRSQDANPVKITVAATDVSVEPSVESKLLQGISKLIESQQEFQKQTLEILNNIKTPGNPKVPLSASTTHKAPHYNKSSKYVVFCPIHNLYNHSLGTCNTFTNWTPNERYDYLRQRRICFNCLDYSHISYNCPSELRCTKEIKGKSCNGYHHQLLHNYFSEPADEKVRLSTHHLNVRDGVLLMSGFVRSGSHNVGTVYDPCSTGSLITTRMANRLGLKGRRAQINVEKIGGTMDSYYGFVYEIPLTDNENCVHKIIVAGMDEITSNQKSVNVSNIAKQFEVNEKDIARPEKIDLLIGLDQVEMMPDKIKVIDKLQLMKNKFGLCVRGVMNNEEMNRLEDDSVIKVSINHTLLSTSDDWCVTKRIGPQHVMENFFETESLGVNCNMKCGSCKCGQCKLNGEMTIKEERELKLIEEGLKYDALNKRWTSQYPWIVDPNLLPNNYVLARSRFLSLERKLLKKGTDYHQRYKAQIEDLMTRGVAEVVSPEVRELYEGPVFYLPHREVLSSSTSTPMRIVFNSSSVFKGYTLNDCLAKGPDVLNNLWGILLRYRENYIAFIGDIRKMYHSVFISELDKHTHRFLWRSDPNSEILQLALNTCTFGDKPAGIISMLAMKKTAEMSGGNDKAKKIIIHDSYVDDILGGGETIGEAKEITTEADKILEQGNFHIKKWIIKGIKDPEIENDTMKVLGMRWNFILDVFFFEITLHFKVQQKKSHDVIEINSTNFQEEFPPSLTRRIILSQIAALHDPIGLIPPFSLKAKLFMRKVVLAKEEGEDIVPWDKPVSQELYAEAKNLFEEMLCVNEIAFPRCMKPTDVVGEPSLIVFTDGSMSGYGACAYIRWELGNGQCICRLIAAKGKICPMKQITIPKIELCGAVTGSRLCKSILSELTYSFEKVILLTDSQIVLGQLQKESFRFNTFVANRVAEVQNNTDPKQWYWIKSEENPADLVSRGCHPHELGVDSFWQRAPAFLCDPFEEWPIENAVQVELTDLAYKAIINLSTVNECLIDISRFSKYNRLISTTARVLKVANTHSMLSLFDSPTATDLLEAQNYWIRIVQKSLIKNFQERFKKLGPKLQDGIITVGSRISKWMKSNWNADEFILLTPDHPFTRLYVMQLHQQDHSGVEVTLAKLQSKFWVPKARKLIKNIKSSCTKCRKLDLRLAQQEMGSLPLERLEPSPPFTNTSLDLFGPFQVNDTVKRRVKTKVYGVIFNCLATRAVYIDLAEGYDTASFIKVLQRFTSIRGFPRRLYSDNATQLVSSNRELQMMVSKWNAKEVFGFGRFEGMTWVFNKSADAPWENGCSESLIRGAKKAIGLSIGESTLTFGDLQTVMFEVSNLMNSRPIGHKPGYDISSGSYLCPNDILLGRTNNSVPSGVWDENAMNDKRFDFMNRVVDTFWKKWQRDYFPSLIVRQKWHTKGRAVQVRDVVLIQDHNALRGQWRIGIVTRIAESSDGLVRDVEVRCVNMNDKGAASQVSVKRSVHRIVVLLPIEEQ